MCLKQYFQKYLTQEAHTGSLSRGLTTDAGENGGGVDHETQVRKQHKIMGKPNRYK